MIHNNNILKIITFCLLAISFACFAFMKDGQQIVHTSDIEPYMKEWPKDMNHSIDLTEAQLDFWSKKLAEQPASSIYKIKTAHLLSEQFKQTGNIDNIHQSDSLLKSVLDSKTIRKAPFYRALSANAITQHEFQEALLFAKKSLESALRPELSDLMRFDALMEIGAAEKARQILLESKEPTSFDYVIRKAKLQDHDGDLDGAIKTMEEAAEWCRERQNKPSLIWTLSNLGDMYGHAGRIKDSYRSFLDVLQLDPSYSYALKGIAWIAFSNDKNTQTAKSIVDHLLNQQERPDLFLLMSEIASFEGNIEKAEEWKERFIATVSQPPYGRMYDKYLAELYLDEEHRYRKSQYFIERELANRPCASTYVLLARYEFKNGETGNALSILNEKVDGQTFEPHILYQAGIIYKAAGEVEKARHYLNEADEAAFELGPVISKKIKNDLSEINRNL